MYIIETKVSSAEQIAVDIAKYGSITVKNLRAALKNWTKDLAVEARNELQGRTLNKRSGKMLSDVGRAGSFTIVEVSPDVYVIRYKDTIVPYAAIHQSGGIIRPKSGKFLAIPLTPTSSKKPITSFRNTFLRKSKTADGYTVFQRIDKYRAVPIFILRKQVKIPKRPWFTNTVTKAEPKLYERLKQVTGEYSG